MKNPKVKLKSIQVNTYAGYRADERPVKISYKGREHKITDIISRTNEEVLGEGMVRRFAVKTDEGLSFKLRHSENQDQWFLEE